MGTRRSLYMTMFLLGAAAFPQCAGAQGGDGVSVQIRVDDSVRGLVPPILLNTVRIEPDSSAFARDLADRSPPARAVPVIFIIVGTLTIPIVLQMIQELLRETYYGGVVIDARSSPPNITSDPRIPANMVFVTNADGKTNQFTSNQLSADLLRKILNMK
jgi:hypothetical protein